MAAHPNGSSALRAAPSGNAALRTSPIPLLDASSLPGAEDWVLLESIATLVDADIEADGDHLGCLRLAASLDE